jgi:hypothetical protein
MRVPRRLLEHIGFEKELGLHNAEMQTTPQPLSPYGLRAQEAEVQARLDAAQREVGTENMRLVSDGLWTVPPIGETASTYLGDSVVQNGVRIGTNMSDSVRYHAMANTDYAAEMTLECPHVSLAADTVMPESLITSIQPHYQVSRATDLPEYFRYALRVAGPLVALGVNSPFFPPDLYDDADADEVLAETHLENRIRVFESVLNPIGTRKVGFPEEFDSVEAAVDRVAVDETVVPMLYDEGDRFDDRFAHLRHKHGSYWRWLRPVFDGPTRSAANARIEFRPLPAQPTVRDSVAFLAVFAGLMESLPRHEHPVSSLDWRWAEANFYAAVEDGLAADLRWITADGTDAESTDELCAELFEYARDGLELRGLSTDEAREYIRPLRERADRGVTPGRWKFEDVRDRVDAGVPLAEAIWGMQSRYIDCQAETLVEGSFVDWLD